VAHSLKFTSVHLLDYMLWMLLDDFWWKFLQLGVLCLIILSEVKSAIYFHVLNGYGKFYLFMLKIMKLFALNPKRGT
jgi:hypothetical protein